MRNSERRGRAFEQFKKVAQAERANGCETLVLFKYARIFTTAPLEETKSWLTIMCYASRKGDQDFVRMCGEKLRYWSEKQGYMPALSGLLASVLAYVLVG